MQHAAITHKGIDCWAVYIVGFAQKACQLWDASRQLALSLSNDSCHLFVDIAVIVESTYGVSKHLPRDQREQRFVEKVRGILTRGGRVLLPVVALGRAQVSKLETPKPKHSSYHACTKASLQQAFFTPQIQPDELCVRIDCIMPGC